jgi:hypothetical protein
MSTDTLTRRETTTHDPDDTWVCAACATPVSWPHAAFGIAGGPVEQTFANPAGFVFVVVTVDQTANLVLVGEESSDFSWFPGTTWRTVCCGGCGQHLGWRFTGDCVFWALIRTRIV